MEKEWEQALSSRGSSGKIRSKNFSTLFISNLIHFLRVSPLLYHFPNLQSDRFGSVLCLLSMAVLYPLWSESSWQTQQPKVDFIRKGPRDTIAHSFYSPIQTPLCQNPSRNQRERETSWYIYSLFKSASWTDTEWGRKESIWFWNRKQQIFQITPKTQLKQTYLRWRFWKITSGRLEYQTQIWAETKPGNGICTNKPKRTNSVSLF